MLTTDQVLLKRTQVFTVLLFQFFYLILQGICKTDLKKKQKTYKHSKRTPGKNTDNSKQKANQSIIRKCFHSY